MVIAFVNGDGAGAAKELGQSARGLEVDVRSSDAVTAMVAAAEPVFGGLDVPVNNAEVPAERGSVEELAEEERDRVVGVTSKGSGWG